MKYILRKKFFTAGFALTAILTACIFTVTAAVPLMGQETDAAGIIKADKLNMRSAPALSAPPVLILNKGTRVKILKHENDWLQVLHDNRTGYIRNRERYVQIVAAAPEKERKEKGPFQQEGSVNEPSKNASRDIEKKLAEHRKEVLAFTKKETALVDSLNDIDLAINNARKRVTEIKVEQSVLEKEIKSTSAASQKLIQQIKTIEAYAARRLTAIYKLNWLGRFNVLASAETIYELIQRKTALEKILSYDEGIRSQLTADKTRLENLLDRLGKQKETQVSLEKTFENQINLMTRKRAERSELLVEIRNRKSLELAAIDALKRSARALDQKMTALSTSEAKPKREVKISAKSFTELKGLLKMPVKGNIVTSFGSYRNTKFNVVNFRSGIDIKADRGEPIRAVCAGRVIYASWFKGYGNMIIVDHGASYYTVYAHVEEFFKSKGDSVESDEVIATAGDTGSMIGPGLYFEVRHHGKPLDPLEWINRG